jgi:hypothetical protein
MHGIRRWYGTVLLILVIGFLAASCTNASSTSGEGKPPVGERNSLIRIEVIRPEGVPIKGLVEDGDYFQLHSRSEGNLAFKPDVHSKPAKIQVFAIETRSDGTESLRLLDEAEVEIGASSEAKPVAKVYAVRILEVIPRA